MKQGTDVTGELLKAVSRSFYLTIRFLPHEMRPAVALGYMLARATDSVADTSLADELARARVLSMMAEAIAGGEVEGLSSVLSNEMAPAQQNPAERTLLERFGECLDALQTFPESQLILLRKVLSTIINGQLWDISYFREHASVDSDEETKRYAYSVAGCVGEFWTELGYATMGEQFCVESRKDLMRQAGIRYGIGLQLINILRDCEEDAARGRSYLSSEPQKWLNRAERYMDDGIDYSLRLGTFRLRFASVLPALIGKETLRLLRGQAKGRVKIPRRRVYACMLRAVFRCLHRKA